MARKKRPPHSQDTKNKISDSLKGRTGIGMFGKKHSDATKAKIKAKRALQIFSPETREKQRVASFGFKHSDETKIIIRLKRIEAIKQKQGQIHPNFNKSACELFDKINHHFKWNGIHALNGGEYYIKQLGFWVDYYEPNLNLVIEYDELHHKKTVVKDLSRQKQIEKLLNCKFIRIEEIDNFNKIIEMLSNSSGAIEHASF